MEKKVFLKGDKLIIVGKQYTVDNIHTLSGVLNPRNFSERSNDNLHAFGGIHSDSNPLTNWAKCRKPFRFMNRDFITSEAAYLYGKAMFVKQRDLADEIALAPDAYGANRLARGINIDQKLWDVKREQVMTEVLTAKFTQIPEMKKELKATGTKTLAEAGTHPYWSCGITINDPYVMDKAKWKCSNMLGIVLMKIRDSVQ